MAVAGDTIVVGALYEDSSTTGVNSTPDEAASAAGAAYVFMRSGTTWSQQAYLKAANTDADDRFGISVAVGDDTIVVGADGEDSTTTGVNSPPNNITRAAGAAYVFVRSGTTWSQQAYLKASNTDQDDQFGYRVALDGATVVVGALYEDSSTTGVNSTPNPYAREAGAAYVFVRSGTTWSQQAYLKAWNTGAGDRFGISVAVADDTIVIGADREASSTTGINSPANEAASGAGAAYVFVRSGTTWSQQAYLKASNTGADDRFGSSVAVGGDTIVVSADEEDSSTTGVNSPPDEAASGAGAAYVFVRSGTTWSQQAYLKAANTDAGDAFGLSVAVADDTIVGGSLYEDSSTTGVNSPPNEAASGAGAAYIYSTGSLPIPAGPVYLPLMFEFQPQLLATIISTAIPAQPVTIPGMTFYTTTVTLPPSLPSGGTFYLSGSPSQLTPGLVDDGLVLTAGGTEIFRHDYRVVSRPTPTLVLVPRSVLLPWAGQPLTVQFVDLHGGDTQASPLYLVWQP